MLLDTSPQQATRSSNLQPGLLPNHWYGDWGQVTGDKQVAKDVECDELQGPFHYPLNIQGNARPELASFRHHLKSVRKAYKLQHSS